MVLISKKIEISFRMTTLKTQSHHCFLHPLIHFLIEKKSLIQI